MPATKTTREEPDDRYGSQHVTIWGDDGKATIVLVHGLAEHAGRYERTGGLLAEAGYRVVAPDLYGFGRSGGARAYIEDWTDYHSQIDRLIEEARRSSDRPVVLLGHSLGGLVAASYGLSERPQPDLLVLSAPSIGGGAWWQKAMAPLLAAVAPKMLVPNALVGSELSRDPAVGEAYFADPLVFTKTTAQLGKAAFAAQADVAARIHEWHLPTLVMHGGADTIVPARSTASLADHPAIERRLYPRLRHEIFNEPEGPGLIAEVVEWIDAKLEARKRSLPEDENLA